MAQRNSGYAKQPNETYVTPPWVWEVLFEHFPFFRQAEDPCPVNFTVDFLKRKAPVRLIATNPPFSLADAMIERARILTYRAYELRQGPAAYAFLLPHTFDTAKGRKPLWEYPYWRKLVLTKRIRWENLEQKRAGPSSNHAWYIWLWAPTRAPPMMVWE